MQLTRRALLRACLLMGSAMPLAGCQKAISFVARSLGQTVPDRVSVAAGASVNPSFHLLSAAAFGPWPGDLERVEQLGAEHWLEEQLQPERIDDTACDLRARRFETIHLDAGTCYEFRKPVLRQDIIRHTLLRAIYSQRQLFEVMSGFWSDHLNINIDKGDCIYLKPVDDRLVIRAHALGKFRDLIKASALSPAMLVYLDGKENKKGSPLDVPNENYARELLELHTLGVHGGYCQSDVFEVARCLTGWRLRDKWGRGTVYFDESLHDDGEKHVLGLTIPAGGGARDLDLVVDHLCCHPSTARHIALKLVHRFVSEGRPASLVDAVAYDFMKNDGDIKSLLRMIFLSEEFRAAKTSKFKQPFHYIVSCLRACGADTHAGQPLIEYLMRMGQGLFQYPTPDGYPDEMEPWLGTLIWRWNFAFALTSNQIPGVSVSLDELAQAIGARSADGLKPELLFAHFVGRAGSPLELKALADYIARQGLKEACYRSELFGLILASPAFQRY